MNLDGGLRDMSRSLHRPENATLKGYILIPRVDPETFGIYLRSRMVLRSA